MKFLGLVFAAFMLANCSLGYDSEGPYPYSHVNQQPNPNATSGGRYQSTGGQIAKNSPSPIPTPRTKPVPPRRGVVVAQPRVPVEVQRPVPAPSTSTTTVRVGRGDTVYALSRRHGVTVKSIINENNLRPPYLLRPGQALTVPVGSTYIVKRGDTVYGVSRANNITMNDLVRINGLKQPYALNVGQQLKLPGRSASNNQTRVAIAPPPPVSGKGFMWPVSGTVISNFGPKQAGYHNDGVNIRAPMGSSVYAAETGVVVHASNKLRGYGNLILIKHDNGWVTAYAHNDKLLVNKGDQVVRGQVVAQVGSTGRVDSPQLHFEMRKGSRAVNPIQYLRS